MAWVITDSGLFDLVGDLYKQLFVLLGILASNEDLDGETATLDLIKMFGCKNHISVSVMTAAS